MPRSPRKPPAGGRLSLGSHMAPVTFERVSKVYDGDVRAVSDLTLEIPDGELMVFVGPSGCGKTTALRMVAGLEEISEGEIRIVDRVVNGMPPRERDIAMVFQTYALYPHKSVYDNLAFPLRLRGGRRQRVAMGRAIVRERRAFLRDEPLSNLDAKLRTQMRAEISLLHKELAVTTIYVTHDQVEAMTLGERVAVMRKGELQQVAPPQELYDRPANLFVAGFIGSPSMNFMAGALEEGKLRTPLGDIPVSGRLQQVPSGSAAGRDVIVGLRPESFD